MTNQGLQEFDPHYDYFQDLPRFDSVDIEETDSADVKVEKTRRKAFKDDAAEFKDATFWKNFIDQKSQARKLQRDLAGRANLISEDSDLEIISVRRSKSSSGPPAKRRRIQDEERRNSDAWHPLTPGPTPIKSKINALAQSRRASEEIEEVEDSDDETVLVKQAIGQSDPFEEDGDDEGDIDPETAVSIERAKNMQHLRNNPPG